MLLYHFYKLSNRCVMVKRFCIALVDNGVHAVALCLFIVEIVVVEEISKNIFISKRAHVLALSVNYRDCDVSVETHLLKSLSDCGVVRGVGHKTFRNKKSENVHFLSNQFYVLGFIFCFL